MPMTMVFVDLPGGGRLGISPMPGRFDTLEADAMALSHAGVQLLLSMTADQEIPGGPGALGHAMATSNVDVLRLPITDWGTPSPPVQAAWPIAARAAHRLLDAGKTVLAHCYGGHGRSGMAVMRLMVERGIAPETALTQIRAVRPGAVETDEQRNWAAEAADVQITTATTFDDWDGLHALLTQAFAGMKGRIDPPSSLNQMTPDSLRQKATEETLLIASRGAYPVGCVFARQDGMNLYVGKVAVRPALHGQGIGSALIGAAEQFGRTLGTQTATLESRVELTENHRLFERLGYCEVARTAHKGYDQPTSITFAKPLTGPTP